MGLRFSKRIKIMPGVRVNLSARGASLSVGPRGASVNIGRRGVYANASLPGTGLSYRERLDRPSPMTRSPKASPSKTPSPALAPAEIKIRFGEAGSMAILDENGWELSDSDAKAVRAAYRDQLLPLIESRAQEVNRADAAALDVHVGTPPPAPAIALAPEFVVPKPLKPADPRDFSPGTREHREAERRWSSYMEALACWRASKAEHDERHGGPSPDLRLIERAIEDRLSHLQWPRETLISFQMAQAGRLIEADVDLPEIEDMTSSTVTVNKRLLELEQKPLSRTALLRLYQRHVHGILFRVAGEIFAASPVALEVQIAGYTQRLSSATGRVEDEYVLAVTIDRDGWSRIDLSRTDAIDPVAALSRFNCQSAIDAKGHMRAITR